MTCIVEGFKTKKALQECCKCLYPTVDPRLDFYISNPSMFPAGKFEYAGMASQIPEGKKVLVTNHPKRSWFANIAKKDGRLVVA